MLSLITSHGPVVADGNHDGDNVHVGVDADGRSLPIGASEGGARGRLPRFDSYGRFLRFTGGHARFPIRTADKESRECRQADPLIVVLHAESPAKLDAQGSAAAQFL